MTVEVDAWEKMAPIFSIMWNKHTVNVVTDKHEGAQKIIPFTELLTFSMMRL